jgi:hypothetical protein
VWEERVKERPAFLNFPAGLAITGAVPIMAQNECVHCVDSLRCEGSDAIGAKRTSESVGSGSI